ncbi:hypothetical protein [uncultured Dokdonia sp.]|uniref:hypothetical protein n=1 Tax=uncultured Dokdonia sp. TaxID=575653 RepID=UPI00261C3600|nr:hypothetical protein [uncultured Dokdonia sp.]
MNTTINTQIANYAGIYQSMSSPAVAKSKQPYTPTDAEKKVFTEAKYAWETYSKSAAGKAELKTIAAMDVPAARSSVGDILDNPAFAKLLQMLNTLDLPASSFSFGVTMELELILGFEAVLGVAIGIGDSKNLASSEFLTLGLTEGIDEGGLVGVQFGLWKNAPADIGGYSWSTEIDLGLGAEVEVAGSYTASGGILGATLTIGGGEEDGADEEESYTFILGNQEGDGYLKPVYQPRKNNFLIITSMKCDSTQSDGAGSANEVYFTFQADGDTLYHYPTYDYLSMESGDTWNCGRSVWFNETVQVNAYDEDDTSGDDPIGNFTINISDLTLGGTKTFNSTKDYSTTFDTVKYTINVKLVAQNVQN